MEKMYLKKKNHTQTNLLLDMVSSEKESVSAAEHPQFKVPKRASKAEKNTSIIKPS